MTNHNEPVKPAMTDAQCEAMIAEYLTRKLAPVAARSKTYSALMADAKIWGDGSPARVTYACYTEQTGTSNDWMTIEEATRSTLAELGDTRTAKRLREEAAAKIARAEQIEAAQAESEVAK